MCLARTKRRLSIFYVSSIGGRWKQTTFVSTLKRSKQLLAGRKRVVPRYLVIWLVAARRRYKSKGGKLEYRVQVIPKRERDARHSNKWIDSNSPFLPDNALEPTPGSGQGDQWGLDKKKRRKKERKKRGRKSQWRSCSDFILPRIVFTVYQVGNVS